MKRALREGCTKNAPFDFEETLFARTKVSDTCPEQQRREPEGSLL